MKQYPESESFTIPPQVNWEEARMFNSILGKHLLIKQNDQWLHLDANTMQNFALPNDEKLGVLLEDAFSINSERYGIIDRGFCRTLYIHPK